MRVIKVLVLHLAFVALFLLVLDRLAAMLLAEPALSRPKALGTETRTLATWPLRSDPALGWALAPPPEEPAEMGQGYQLSHAGIGLRWLPGTMDMGPPLVMLVLGDETAFGPTGPLQDTFGGGIKRATEERLHDRTMAVATAAVPGYDALQMCLQFKRLASLRPHLALFCFSAGQTLAPTMPLWRPTSIRPALTKELLYRPSLAQALYLGIDRLTGGTELTGVSWDVAPERIRQDAAEDFDAVIQEIARHADRVRVPVLMTSLGLPEQYRSVLEARCLQEGVAYLDGDEALLEHAEESRAVRAPARAGVAGPEVGTVAPLDRTNEAHAWWIQQQLRPRVRPIFLSRVYFSPALLPTRAAHRVLGEALALAIAEGDLFSWRHRVLQ